MDSKKQISSSEENVLFNFVTDAIKSERKGEINIINTGSIRVDLKREILHIKISLV